jgi:hypothetical protein
MLRVKKSPPLRDAIRTVLQPAVRDAKWPREFRSWENALLGLLGSQIGGIASPFLREAAAQRLFRAAKRSGLSKANLLMIADDIYRVEKRVQHAQIAVERS